MDVTTVVGLGGWTALFYFGRLGAQRAVQGFVASHKGIKKGKAKAFSESAWKLVFYACVWLYGIAVGAHIVADSTLTFAEYPAWNPTLPFRMYVLCQLGFYLASFIHHVDGTEEVRSDWWEMLIHHVVTCGLIYASYALNLGYWAVVVFTLHDITDVTLETAKMLGYYDHPASTPLWLTTMALWAYLRIYLYFYKVLLVVWNAPHNLYSLQYSFLAFLSVIYGLNCFWFSLMVRGLLRVITGKDKARDTRED